MHNKVGKWLLLTSTRGNYTCAIRDTESNRMSLFKEWGMDLSEIDENKILTVMDHLPHENCGIEVSFATALRQAEIIREFLKRGDENA